MAVYERCCDQKYISKTLQFIFELVDISCDVKIGSADVTIAVDGAIKKVRQNQNWPPP